LIHFYKRARPPAMSAGFKPSEGDWPCPDPSCGNVNFARRTSSNRRNVDKHKDNKKTKGGIKIGGAAAEKSKGLFSADDWQCSKCGNVNWARRSTCNVCNGPQFNTEEERTGLGGGFDERGTVEYKERTEDSDPEYDDLGRRKKRKLPPGYKRPEPPRMPTPEPEEEEEEEEEDDEDDDGDLSKYDLWGGDDDADKKDVKEEEKNGKNDEGKKDDPKDVVKRKKSRSRSRSRSSTKDKKRSRRSRSSSSSSSSSSSRSRSRSKGRKRSKRSSSSSSSSRSR